MFVIVLNTKEGTYFSYLNNTTLHNERGK